YARRGERGWAVYSAVSGGIVLVAVVLASYAFPRALPQTDGVGAFGGGFQRIAVIGGWGWLSAPGIPLLMQQPAQRARGWRLRWFAEPPPSPGQKTVSDVGRDMCASATSREDVPPLAAELANGDQLVAGRVRVLWNADAQAGGWNRQAVTRTTTVGCDVVSDA